MKKIGLKKIKLRYIDSILNARFSSLEKKSSIGSFIVKEDGVIFERQDKSEQIIELKSIKVEEINGFRVEKWLRIDYVNEIGKEQTTYITRRSFYHPSTTKIETKLKELFSLN